jgi:hypothetical protein
MAALPVYGPPSPSQQLQSRPGQFNLVSRNYNTPSGYGGQSQQGQVFGATTTYQPPAGSGSVGSGGTPTGGSPTGGEDPYAGLRNDISSSWDSYLNSLQGVGGYLNDSRASQEGIANSQYDQGINMANNQKASSLRDIANTTRNAFQAGNNYLGAMGSGDSSAANQYAFAINQQAGKQTGDLNNFVDQQIQGLKSTHDQQINQIAQWFAQQQEALKQQIAQGGLQKGQDLANLSKGILDQAMQATNAIKSNSQNQYNALLTWAANNSTNIGQLQNNIAAIPQAMGQLQTNGGYGGANSMTRYGGAPISSTKTDIFGNPIS